MDTPYPLIPLSYEPLALALEECNDPSIYIEEVQSQLGERLCKQLQGRGILTSVVGYLAEAEVSGMDVTLLDAFEAGLDSDPMYLEPADVKRLSEIADRFIEPLLVALVT